MADLNVLKSRLKINTDNLMVECSIQPMLYDEIADLFILAKVTTKTAKINLEYEEASIGIELKNKDPKITVKSLENTITINKEILESRNELIKLEKSEMELKYLLDAFEQRRSMLGNAVDLFLHGYREAQDISKKMPTKYVDAEVDGLIEKIAEKRRKDAENKREK